MDTWGILGRIGKWMFILSMVASGVLFAKLYLF